MPKYFLQKFHEAGITGQVGLAAEILNVIDFCDRVAHDVIGVLFEPHDNVFCQDRVEHPKSRMVGDGQAQPGGLVVVEEGIKPGEWIVVSGIQLVRPGQEVSIDKRPMPVTANPMEKPVTHMAPEKGTKPAAPEKKGP